MNNAYIYLIIFLTSVISGVFLNRFFINRQAGFLIKKANDNAVRWSSQSKPIFGGITFYSVFVTAMIAYLFIYGFEITVTKEFLSLFIVVTLSFFMGLADDLISTPPSFKFIIQFLAAAILIFSGIYIKISPYEILNYTITVLWVVGIMNSINMLDNMDAITSVTSLSIIGSTVVCSLLCSNIEASPLTIFVSIALVGALISFIYFNWHPSKMYMGDNGSQVLGSFLAFIGIIYFWNSVDIASVSYGYNTKQIIIVALAFVVPLTDTTSVTINRLLRKQSPFVGGRDHTTHHLSYLGLTERMIAILLFTLNSVGLYLAYKVINTTIWNNKLFWLYLIYPMVVFICLYSITKISKPKQ